MAMKSDTNHNVPMEIKPLADQLLNDALPRLVSTVDKYFTFACNRCMPGLQPLLLGELNSRIRNIQRLLHSIVHLADASSALHFQSLVSVVQGDVRADIEFEKACDQQDQLWLLSETFYWNCARCLAILYGEGVSKKLAADGLDLPGLCRAKKPFINVSFVRHKLIEHPEAFGGSLAVGAATSGPLLGEKDEGGTVCDMGLYANALEFVELVCSRVASAK